MALLPCYIGDPDPRLSRVSDPIKQLDLDFWVLTHPDLRNAARVRTLMAHLYDGLGEKADLWGGRTRATDTKNFSPR